MITFEIPGQPMGKQRPRFSSGGNFIRTYTPKQTRAYEQIVKYAYLDAVTKMPYGRKINYFDKGEYLCVDILAFFKVPKNYSKKKTEQCLKDQIRPVVKSDADNIAKIILDGLNKVAYDDDKQVVELTVQKYYNIEPKVVVRIYEPWER